MFLHKYLVFLFMLLTFTAAYSTFEQTMHTICCHAFGHKNASKDVQKHFNGAKTAFEISPTTPMVKQINKCPFLNQFSSFTWAGTWINADEWEKISFNEKQWLSFHETAHTFLNHPIKQIQLIALYTALMITAVIQRNGPLCLLITATLPIIPLYARQCEKEADIAAAIKLKKLGQINLIQQQINDLKNQNDTSFSLWFHSPAEIACYLQNAIRSTNKSLYNPKPDTL